MNLKNNFSRLLIAAAFCLTSPFALAVPVEIKWDMAPQSGGSTGTGTGVAYVDSSLLAPSTSTISDFANLFSWSFALTGLPGAPSSTSFGLSDLVSWILTTDAAGDIIDFNFRTIAQNSDGYGLNAIASATINVCTGATGSNCSGGTTVGTYSLVNYRVPEPATLVLMGLGLAGLGYQGRKKIKAA